MSQDRMKEIESVPYGAFVVTLYLLSEDGYTALITKADGKKIRVHEGDEYSDISTSVFDTKLAAVQDAVSMIDKGGMT